jgi:hypothetical protein
MTAKVAISPPADRRFTPHWLQIAIGLSLSVLAANHAAAQQYPQGGMGGAAGSTGGGTYTAPRGDTVRPEKGRPSARAPQPVRASFTWCSATTL